MTRTHSTSLNVLCVIGSMSKGSATHRIVADIAGRLERLGASVDIFDPQQEPLPLLDPASSFTSVPCLALKPRVDAADVYVLATPDYHGSVSGTLKNFLDHFWKEFAGKLFVPVVASREKGLTVMDQIRTIARQCYCWSLPYGVAYSTREDLSGELVPGSELDRRLEMLTCDMCSYGRLLASQRRVDLVAETPGFMARHRRPVSHQAAG